MTLSLHYGKSQPWVSTLADDAFSGRLLGPPPLADVGAATFSALAHPLEFPQLSEAVLPEDRVIIALDRDVPQAPAVIAAIWEVLEKRGLAASQLTILQPAGWGQAPADPRTALPAEIASEILWRIHDPTNAENIGYLASSLSGERVYLSRTLTEADFVLPVGRIGFDPLLGYCGTASVFYPGMSNAQAIAKTHRMGHSELRPDHDRPLRQLIDEIAWLLGVQFTVQVVPGAAPNSVSAVLAGSLEAVQREGVRQLQTHWKLSGNARADTVIIAADSGSGGSWELLGTALSVARRCVARGGRIIALTNLGQFQLSPDVAAAGNSGGSEMVNQSSQAEPIELGTGFQIVQAAGLPRDAVAALAEAQTPDMIPATQLADAADFAQIYLLSDLPGDLVEDLFMVPLANERELNRLLENVTDCVVIGQAQYAWAELAE